MDERKKVGGKVGRGITRGGDYAKRNQSGWGMWREKWTLVWCPEKGEFAHGRRFRPKKGGPGGYFRHKKPPEPCLGQI